MGLPVSSRAHTCAHTYSTRARRPHTCSYTYTPRACTHPPITASTTRTHKHVILCLITSYGRKPSALICIAISLVVMSLIIAFAQSKSPTCRESPKVICRLWSSWSVGGSASVTIAKTGTLNESLRRSALCVCGKCFTSPRAPFGADSCVRVCLCVFVCVEEGKGGEGAGLLTWVNQEA